MRWGEASASTSLRWVRPLHGIVALLGEEIVPVEIDGIASGATTVGHRFHHPGPITIGGAHDYAEKLRACHVIVDQEERETIDPRGRGEGGRARPGWRWSTDEGLVVENAGLTEWPVPLLGRFDPDFLDVPREVIVLTMRTNQKYFACADEDGGARAGVRLRREHRRERRRRGDRRGQPPGARGAAGRRALLLGAGLKVPLEEQATKLDGIVFHEKLGTVADKVERVAKLARMAGRGSGSSRAPTPSRSERAARLAKADLVTGMVGEFPELQGVIGGYLADAQGEPSAVADAIRDHYKPVGQGDEVPTAPVTVAVSLADRLDSLVAFFAIDEKPTGSRDPFALRRAALGRQSASAAASMSADGLLTFALGIDGHFRTARRRRHADGSTYRMAIASSRKSKTRIDAARSSRATLRGHSRLLRRPAEGPAARGRRSARPDRRGVRAWRRGRSRPACWRG